MRSNFFDRNSSTGTLTAQSAIVDGANGVDGLVGATCIVLSSDGNLPTPPLKLIIQSVGAMPPTRTMVRSVMWTQSIIRIWE